METLLLLNVFCYLLQTLPLLAILASSFAYGLQRTGDIVPTSGLFVQSCQEQFTPEWKSTE